MQLSKPVGFLLGRLPVPKRGRPVSASGGKRSSLDVAVIPSLTTASQLSKALSKTNSTAATLTALQHLAHLQQQHNHNAVPQREQQQRAKLISKLLMQMATRITKLPAGSLCRLAFILARLRGVANIKPLWQAVLRQLMNETEAAAAAEQPELLHSAVSTDELLYLVRALADFQAFATSADTSAHRTSCTDGSTPHPDEEQQQLQQQPEQAGVLLAAAVAAARARQAEFVLQDLLLLITALARLRHYDRQLLADSSGQLISAVKALQQPTAAQAAQQHSHHHHHHQQQQQQHSRMQGQRHAPVMEQHSGGSAGSKGCEALSEQLVINFLWAAASLGHSSQQLLQAALQWLLLQPVPSPQQQQQQPQQHSCESHLSRMPVRLLPMCAWSLAALLILCLDSLDAAGSHASSTCSCAEATALVQTTVAVHGVLMARAAAEAPGSAGAQNVPPSAGQTAAGPSWKQPTAQHERAAEPAVVFSAEGLAQLHHAGMLIRAAWTWAFSTPPAGAATAASEAPDDDGQQLLPAAFLLCLAQQEQQQQQSGLRSGPQMQVAMIQLLVLENRCRAAWRGNRQSTSFLQLEVYQALQQLGLKPQLEVAATLLHTAAQRQQVLQQLSAQPGAAPAAGDRGSVDAADESGDALVVDIACVMPAATARALSDVGLRAMLMQQQQHGKLQIAPVAQTAASAEVKDRDYGGRSQERLLVAVEVDGPSHAAVNDRSHLLGSTLCRNWLLRQMGWQLLAVPWWEWDSGVCQ